MRIKNKETARSEAPQRGQQLKAQVKRGPGRPPKDPAGKLTARVWARVTEGRYDTYKAAAAAKGKSLTDWVLDLLDRAVKPPQSISSLSMTLVNHPHEDWGLVVRNRVDTASETPLTGEEILLIALQQEVYDLRRETESKAGGCGASDSDLK